jgi:ERCC4-related helicase
MGLNISPNPEHVNGYTLINLQKQLAQHPPPGMRGGQIHQARTELGFCATLLCGRNYLASYGVPCLSRYLREKLHDAADRKSTELRATPEYVKFMQMMTAYTESGAKHPKLERLETVIVQHFRSIILPAPAPDSVSQPQGTPMSQSRASRVIVFCENRNAVEEIVDALQAHRPLIKAMPFVGQV